MPSTMTGTDINREARVLLGDTAVVHWTAPNMIDWINAFQRDVVTHKPKAGAVTKLLDITQSVAKQSLPANTIQLLDIHSNMGANGTTPGRAVSLTTQERLAASLPTWRQSTGAYVRHWWADDRDETCFYVWPLQTGATKVEARTVDIPTLITALTDTLTLNSSYQNAGVHYVMFKAYSQDGTEQDSAQLAAAHYMMYASIIGIKVKGEKRVSPGANSTVNPAHPDVDKNGASPQ